MNVSLCLCVIMPWQKLQWKALDEIDAGACDGMTYEQIAKEMPEEYAARKKDKLRYRCEGYTLSLSLTLILACFALTRAPNVVISSLSACRG